MMLTTASFSTFPILSLEVNTMRRIPSIKTLTPVFGGKSSEARKILGMTRSELEALPAGAARVAECYHPPKTYDLRLTCLDALGETCGVEAFQLRDGSYCDYLNTGDTYTPTLLRFRGNYRVACWGDIAERHA
jgi:hypothetical protein